MQKKPRLYALDVLEDNGGGVTHIGWTTGDLYAKYDERSISLSNTFTVKTSVIIRAIGAPCSESYNQVCERFWKQNEDRRDPSVTLKGIEKLTIYPIRELENEEVLE